MMSFVLLHCLGCLLVLVKHNPWCSCFMCLRIVAGSAIRFLAISEKDKPDHVEKNCVIAAIIFYVVGEKQVTCTYAA